MCLTQGHLNWNLPIQAMCRLMTGEIIEPDKHWFKWQAPSKKWLWPTRVTLCHSYPLLVTLHIATLLHFSKFSRPMKILLDVTKISPYLTITLSNLVRSSPIWWDLHQIRWKSQDLCHMLPSTRTVVSTVPTIKSLMAWWWITCVPSVGHRFGFLGPNIVGSRGG